ncbi:MAG: glycosyltransferase family 4 protein [Chloroflexi bacterium]|nr:glycosyltransferase family 4 protein [Chloroflexota bacterium]MCI0725293.1 glycosyltransferase family 4 protein [Chloroflexota bacterium]
MVRLHQAFTRLQHTSDLLVKAHHAGDPHILTFQNIARRQSLFPLPLTDKVAAISDAWFGLPNLHSSTRQLLQSELLQQADVVNLHNLHGRYFNYHLLPELTAYKPVIWTLHDMWAFTGHCAYSYDCQRWQNGCFRCPLLRNGGRRIVEPKPTLIDRTQTIWRQKRQLYERAKPHVVTPSNWLLSLVQKSILTDAASLHCIPNGVDLEIFCPQERAMVRRKLDVPLDAKVVMFIAARVTSGRKGFAYLLEALKEVENEPVFLLTIGEQVAVEDQLQHFKWRHLGHVEDEATLSQAYNAADLFVFPTLADNQPLVIIEALACGTPVVSFNVGGVPEMVRHMETGYLARYKDVGDLAGGMATLLRDDAGLLQMRQRCREVAVAEYGLALQAHRYLALYEQAIEGYARRSFEQTALN